MEIKPIETVYKGYRFRSRLEARWAVFFDKMGVKYEYELEGFTLPSGLKYLPDFYLPESETYVEIKGIGAIKIVILDEGIEIKNGRENGKKYAEFIDTAIDNGKRNNYILAQGDPFDVFMNHHGGNGMAHIFFTGECVMHGQNITCDNGENCKDCRHSLSLCCYPLSLFVDGKPCIADALDRVKFMTRNDNIVWLLLRENEEPIMVCSDEDNIEMWLSKTIKAAVDARQSRFEYGERGMA